MCILPDIIPSSSIREILYLPGWRKRARKTGGMRTVSYARKKGMTVRMSVIEKEILKEAASEYGISISSLLRECTLGDGTKRLVDYRMSDLHELSTLICELDDLVSSLLHIIPLSSCPMSDSSVRICSLIEEIDSAYIKLTVLVLKYRKKLADCIRSELHKRDASRALSCRKKENVSKKGMNVAFSEEELQELHVLSRDHNCPICRLLVENAVHHARSRHYFVDSHSLDGLAGQVRRELLFLNAIISDARENNVEEEHFQNSEDILLRIKDELLLHCRDIRCGKRVLLREMKHILLTAKEEF